MRPLAIVLRNARLLKIFEILKTGSVPEEQARAMTQALQKAEAELALDVRTVMEQQFALFRETFATKSDLAQLETRLTRWMLGFWVSQVVATVSVVFAAFKLFR